MDRLKIETYIKEYEAAALGRTLCVFSADEQYELAKLALQSLSQEAVRDEALEEAASVDQREVELRGWREAIRALKRDPNAAAESYESAHPKALDEPAPAAPDVASMVKRLRNCCTMIGYATSGAERTSHKRNADDAEAALLARLGQGWIPVSERLPEDRENVLVLEYGLPVVKRLCIPDYLTPSRGITHWMPLPPLPGALDD